MVWGWSLFRSRSTPIRPRDQPIKLVTAGAFQFSRNPMYLGIGAMLFGLALAIGSLPMLVAPIGFLVLMDRVFIPYEEQRLRKTFGSVYEEYQNDVRRWL
jgi:protein-S-isoprenylcysteine O-methyltransferase Ste14